MEIFGILVLVAIVSLNAISFFGSGALDKQTYKRTVSDTKFNRGEKTA
jgi:hypothetical protein